MNKNLLDLSGKIDDTTIQLFETVARVAESLSIPFFVVGAMARELIQSHGYNIKTIRATQDIDLGVQVSDWDEYQLLRKGLTGTGEFTSAREAQRLVYGREQCVDIIPFGTIADPDNTLSWPPDFETTMSTLGFDEAYYTAMTVRLRSDPPLDILFASLAALAVMKIIAWNDDHVRGRKDAQDLLLLTITYLEAGNQNRLFNEERDLVNVDDFDYVRAGARLLGRDIAAMLRPDTASTILSILTRETGEQNRYRLVEDMIDLGTGSEVSFEDRLIFLEELRSGIIERI